MKKNIIIGVCGSIAAYKSAEIVREFKKKDWKVKVIMTEDAMHFITPLTLSTLSGDRVYSDMFTGERDEESHIALADFADILLVAPATANIIGRVASGICDSLLTCTIFATRTKVVFAPAMNTNMWNNEIVRDNVARLKKCGYLFIEPEEGELASGERGVGRLADPGKIAAFVEKAEV